MPLHTRRDAKYIYIINTRSRPVHSVFFRYQVNNCALVLRRVYCLCTFTFYGCESGQEVVSIKFSRPPFRKLEILYDGTEKKNFFEILNCLLQTIR